MRFLLFSTEKLYGEITSMSVKQEMAQNCFLSFLEILYNGLFLNREFLPAICREKMLYNQLPVPCNLVALEHMSLCKLPFWEIVKILLSTPRSLIIVQL